MRFDHRTSSTVWRAASTGLATALLVAAVAPGTASASEQDPNLVLSVDGSVWVQDVLTPMFDAAHVWTPGDVGTYTVLFRNDSGEPARAVAELLLEGPAAEVFEPRLRMDGSSWQDGPSSSVVEVAAGQVVQLDLELGLAPSSATIRTPLTADVSAQVTLRSVVPGPGDEDGGAEDGGAEDGDGPGDTDTGTGSNPGGDGHEGQAGEPGSGIGTNADEGFLAWTGVSPTRVVLIGVALGGLGLLLLVTARRQQDSGPAGTLPTVTHAP